LKNARLANLSSFKKPQIFPISIILSAAKTGEFSVLTLIVELILFNNDLNFSAPPKTNLG
jgi:hypothetical protein